MFFAALIAVSSAAYGAPASDDAYEAFIVPILAPIRYSGDVLGELVVRQRPDFPAVIELQKCVRKNQREVRLESGLFTRFDGYECVFEVFPNAEPSFRNVGFFRYDSFDWVYHGPVAPLERPLQIMKASPRIGDPMVPKDGALKYDGSPYNLFYDDYAPYEELFNASERSRDGF